MPQAGRQPIRTLLDVFQGLQIGHPLEKSEPVRSVASLHPRNRGIDRQHLNDLWAMGRILEASGPNNEYLKPLDYRLANQKHTNPATFQYSQRHTAICYKVKHHHLAHRMGPK
ncbi:hypothetical protein AtubIFM56815_008334 [Aspergillus tubingensis]|uniref:Uncharacterized protein n=1 Tax=Aspergillus tubingensis TaxID=5068 RepID=A0A9W6AP46_ASPTU|nr:hypothetical protein AtubIFM54640_003084 [Aspergillus tubingensis]GLA84124.1 hypothetical protein AtubIFM56815_008334 [Aspergillus tubingensis]GLA99985.1 hypothetical protein AtubIFM57143_008686 [Aspergillus tubingensis]